jgi:hypothetical protein
LPKSFENSAKRRNAFGRRRRPKRNDLPSSKRRKKRRNVVLPKKRNERSKSNAKRLSVKSEKEPT